MDNAKLFADFRKHVDDMTDEDVVESISKAVNDTTPTVEAIPVEQAARMLLNFCSKKPCDFYHDYDKDRWCDDNCMCDTYKCWLHALREGWFDDDAE